MFKKYIENTSRSTLALTLLFVSASATSLQAQNYVGAPITGNVESKCVITTDTPGVYGNPLSDKLSTLPSDGGVNPIIRYDIIEASAYKARISYPLEFSTSPSLNDIVNWDGDVEIEEVSNAAMSEWESTKVQYENVTEFDLELAGSVWFKTESEAEYGYGKSFPGGTYRSAVTAECIAQ